MYISMVLTSWYAPNAFVSQIGSSFPSHVQKRTMVPVVHHITVLFVVALHAGYVAILYPLLMRRVLPLNLIAIHCMYIDYPSFLPSLLCHLVIIPLIVIISPYHG
jgi:hypothetical protein